MCKTIIKYIIYTNVIIAFFICNFSCRKLDKSTELESINKFNAIEAKEWWYGVFKKSTEYSTIDENATNVRMIKKMTKLNNIQFSNNRMPIWSKAISYSVGKFECVEFPLAYGHKVTIIDGEKNLTTEQKYKLVDTKLEKVVLIKQPNGKIEVRIVSILPKYAYALDMNFDISNNQTNYIDPTFKGIIQVRKWSETIIHTKEIVNNKVVKIIKDKLQKTNNKDALSRDATDATCPEGQNCPNGGYWQSFFTHVCENNNYSSGDVVVVVGCLHSSLNTYVCDYWQCNSEGDDDEDEDETPIDCTTNVLPYEECMCAYYDLNYCSDNGDDGNDDDNDNDDPCATANDLKSDTLKNTQAIKNLRDSAVNGKTETSHFYVKDASGDFNDVSHINGKYDVLGIDFPIPPGIGFDGLWHNHFDKAGALNMYSSGDMVSLMALFTNGNMTNSNDFFLGLTTQLDDSYLLTIEDTAKFRLYTNRFPGLDPVNMINNQDKLDLAMVYVYKIKSGVSKDENEKRMAQYLNNENTGLKLMKADLNQNKFSKIDYDKDLNKITITPCN
jgi:hypothetical protein